MKTIINQFTAISKVYGEVPYRCHNHLIVNGSIQEGKLSADRLQILSNLLSKLGIVPDEYNEYTIHFGDRIYDICGSYLTASYPQDMLSLEEVYDETNTQDFVNLEPTVEHGQPVKYLNGRRYILNNGYWTRRRFSRNKLEEMAFECGFIHNDIEIISNKVLYDYIMYHHPAYLQLEVILCNPDMGNSLLSGLLIKYSILNLASHVGSI